MTTTANIQANGNTAVQNTNYITEEGTMNHASNNINMVTRISNAFRMGSISKFVAGATLGLALAIGLALPGAARADSPLVSVASSNISAMVNDDFSMIYGIPDNGPGRFEASASASAMVRINTDVDGWNDDFSLVYGTPDSGLDFGGISTGAPAKVKLNTVTGLWNDDFSLVYGTPDSVLDFGGFATSASAKVRLNAISGMVNDDFSMVYGVPDNGPGRHGTSSSAKVKINAGTDGWNDDFSLVYGTPDDLG